MLLEPKFSKLDEIVTNATETGGVVEVEALESDWDPRTAPVVVFVKIIVPVGKAP